MWACAGDLSAMMKKFTKTQRIWSGTARPMWRSSLGEEVYVKGDGQVAGSSGLETSRTLKWLQRVCTNSRTRLRF